MPAGPPIPDYRKAAQEAESDVSGMSDAELRKVALDKIIADKLVWQPLASYWRDKANRYELFISGGLATVGVLSLWRHWPPWVSLITILGIDSFILFLLVIIGLYADRRANTFARLPHKLPAIAMGGLLLVGSLHAYGNLYMHNDIVCAEAADCSVDRAGSHIRQPGDALYFSVVTMFTLGADFYPRGAEARYIVIWQLGSSVLLVVLLLPLVMSRVATF
jgi:Ion channel